MSEVACNRSSFIEVKRAEFSALERHLLRRFHPRSIVVDIVGSIWFTYFLWNQDWLAAVIAIALCRTIATVAVLNVDVVALSRTILGRIGMLHLNPMNFATQMIGFAILLYGLWAHGTEIILSGISIVFLGHLFGWSNVDTRLADIKPN